MKNIILLLGAITAIFMAGCASSYNAIKPNSLKYTNKQNCNEKFEVSYLYDVYSISDNSKYARKEKKYGYRAIAVQVKNLTDSARLITNDNFKIYANNNEVQLANLNEYFNSVSQIAGSYMLHALWGPWSISTVSDYNGSTTTVRYYFLGLIVGVANTIVASVANTNHQKEIQNAELFGKTIAPGQTISGIVVLKTNQYDPLTFLYLDK